MSKDFYEILGVKKDATEDEIKRAYRKLAQRHHPDRNKGDKSSEEKFKEANTAYEVLSDKKKRQTYDQFGESAFGPGGAGGAQGGFDFGGFSGFGDSFADVFETFFGGGKTRNRSAAINGDDREVGVEISFEEAAFGVEREIKISHISACKTCSGSGATPGTKISACGTCKGSGEIRVVRNTILGQMTSRQVCTACSGSGKVPEKPCTSCHGAGRVRLVEKLNVKIPAGISDGAAIRIVGKGDAGLHGGEGGDLYVHVTIQPHELFSRKGSDVYSEQGIHLVQGVLGDEVNIQTVHGQVKMRIPAGTQPGKVFKLKGYGIQKLKSQEKGDHYVSININIPTKLSKQEREIYEKLAQASGIDIIAEKGFFKKMMGE